MASTGLTRMNTRPQDGNNWRQAGLNLALNLLLPAVILLRAGAVWHMSALSVLLLALAFPLGWGWYELVWHRRYNFYSLVGVAGVILTGGIGVLRLDARWLAVKEAAVPLTIGLGIAVSRLMRVPFVGSLFESVLDRERVYAALRERGTYASYQRLLGAATYAVASSFFLSAALNYILARWLVVSEPGTSAFNQEFGRLTLLSYPIIAGPSLLVLWLTAAWLMWRLMQLSGIPLRQMIKGYAEH